jgi:putative hydrolase of HD superfamily
MYRMGMMSLLASDCGVDSTRCMKMALVHDVAEAIVGDITPHCSVSDEDKFSLESQAIQRIQSMLGHNTQAGEHWFF